ncbi:MAG: ferritin [Candidatus Thermoplasmatota archaeon]|nr:ferritin [Candidatus Thermoplasmatota archaeon]
MISDKMLSALNEQVREELYSAYLYQSMSAFCDFKGLKGIAHWMDMQTKEEMIHARKFYDYILETSGMAKLDTIKAPPHKFGTPLEIFQEALKHEEYITKRIYDLVDLATELKDHATFNMLQWFVNEQVEEEATASEMIDKLNLIGDHPGAMFQFDKELMTRPAPVPPVAQ